MITADLHVHSKYSRDSLLHPRKIVKAAISKGLNCIAVTDHDTVRGGVELLREAKEFKDFIAIPGVELKTDIGDVTILFIEEEIKLRRFNEVMDYVKSIDAITVLPHPYRKHRMIEDAARAVHAIEVLNARTDRRANLKARLLALKLGKPMTAGSDAHTLFEIGKAKTLINGSTIEDVRKALVKGETKIEGSESSPIVHFFSFTSKIVKKIIGEC